MQCYQEYFLVFLWVSLHLILELLVSDLVEDQLHTAGNPIKLTMIRKQQFDLSKRGVMKLLHIQAMVMKL